MIALVFSLLPLSGTSQAAPAERRVLVYTRNFTPDGKGYVHDNIAASVDAIRKMGAESGFGVDASEDPASFTDASLKRYAAIVFSNSNNQAFANDEQRAAFKRYIEAGGGFVGLHSASGSERDWPWFWSVLGGKFAAHPRMQAFTVEVVDPSFPAARNLTSHFEWTDECYFLDHLNPGMHLVLATDRKNLKTLEPMTIDVSKFPETLPLGWYQEFDGGREFYLALGNNKEDYASPLLSGIIRGGILWAMKPNH